MYHSYIPKRYLKNNESAEYWWEKGNISKSNLSTKQVYFNINYKLINIKTNIKY